jgi:hypothetical protein
MTPLIRELCRPRFSRQMPLASARSAKHFLVFVLLLITCSCWSLAAPLQPSQDPNAKPAPVPPAQQSPAASSNSSPRTASEPTPLKKAAHQKKVITEDDLVKPAKPITLSDLEGEENNPICDLSCEAELRAEMGYGPEREAEFRNQLTLVRHEIGDDRVWNSALQTALHAAEGYCGIQRQKAQILGKGEESQYLRDGVNSQFAERERGFVLHYRESAGLLTQRIQGVRRFAPFQATIMQYQWNEALARVCPDYTIP